MITIKSDKPYGGELNIDMWYGDKFEPNKYGADAYDYNGRLSGNIYNEAGKAIGDYTATDSVLVEENFLIDFDVNACDTIEGATKADGAADIIHLYYKGRKIDDTDADDIKFTALKGLIRTDEQAATQILDYLNSLGDPVFPVSEEKWSVPETDVSNVDLYDLYHTFLDAVGYEYDDTDFSTTDEFYMQFGDFEIFSSDEIIESTTKVTGAIKDMHGKVKSDDYRTGYLYLLKHGIGPGTLPKDVTVLKTMDLPHGFTAVWLDSVLTTDELKEYDIPSETQLNDRLAKLGYQTSDNNELVPVESATTISCSDNYDTKRIARAIKSILDDEAFGTAHSHRISEDDAYMGRNGLVYNRREKTVDKYDIKTKERTPLYKVVPQYSSTKKNGTYAPKLPKIVPIESATSIQASTGSELSGKSMVDALNTMDVGTPLLINPGTGKYIQALYVGQSEIQSQVAYRFFDGSGVDGTFGQTKRFIMNNQDRVSMILDDNDPAEVAKLTSKFKGVNASTSINASTVWENYGDADPIQMGRLIKDDGNGRYKMLYIEPVYDTASDRNLLAAWLHFDMDDALNGWIVDDLGEIADTFGTTVDDLMADPMYLFEVCVGYFSIDNFSPEYIGYPEKLATEAEVEAALASIGY